MRTHAIPTLATARLDLCAPTRADFEPYAAIMASDRARFMGGPMTRIEAWYDFASAIAGWIVDGAGYWAIWLRAKNQLAGFTGFGLSPHDPELELGWFLAPEAEGQGIAAEAAEAARNWGFGSGGFSTFVSCIDPANTASIALAERLGAKADLDAPRADPNDLIYRHMRPA